MKTLVWKLLATTLLIALCFSTCEKNPTPPDDHSGNPYKLTKGEYPDWCPAGDSIAFVRDGDLWIYDMTRKKEWRVTHDATQPSFSPDGKKITFERNKRIFTIDLVTKAERY